MDSAVFDTNILIHYAHGQDPARRIITSTVMRYISLVTWVEFMTGVPATEAPRFESFLNKNFEIIDPDRDLAGIAVDLRRSQRLKYPDAMIYATAKLLRVPLITHNTKDFDARAPDIVIPY